MMYTFRTVCQVGIIISFFVLKLMSQNIMIKYFIKYYSSLEVIKLYLCSEIFDSRYMDKITLLDLPLFTHILTIEYSDIVSRII